MESEQSTTEYITDTSGNSVQIVAPVVDLTGEGVASSDGHPSLASPPVVSVHSSSGREPESFHASSAHDAISVHSSHLSSAIPQSSSEDEEVAQARMDAAIAAQEVANQRLAYLRAKKKSSRASKASSIAAAPTPPPGLQEQLPHAPEPVQSPTLPQQVAQTQAAPSQSSRPELPTRENPRAGPLQMLTSMFGGGRREEHRDDPRTEDFLPRSWRDTQLDDARGDAVDLRIIRERLSILESEGRPEQVTSENVRSANVKSVPKEKNNSSFGTPEDLIDLQTPPVNDNKKKKIDNHQQFDLSPRDRPADSLTRREINLKCLKLIDRNISRKALQDMQDQEIKDLLAKAIKKVNDDTGTKVLRARRDPSPSPSSSTSSSTSSSQDLPHQTFQSHVPIEIVTNKRRTVKEKDVKLPPLPEAPDFRIWKDQVFHKILYAAQRGQEIKPWIDKIEAKETCFDDLADPGA